MSVADNSSSVNGGLAVGSENMSVAHGFFGRCGGVSDGLYESLNCSDYVGDSSESVRQNLDVVRKTLADGREGVKLVTLKQIHSEICIEVTPDNADDVVGTEADALVTKEKSIILGILTADCAPILFYDPKTSIIGAAHAGWRGALNGIIASTVRKMKSLGADPSNIVAAIGPCIGKDSYEIDDDFKKGFSGSGDCFCLINWRMHFDLPKFCRKKLITAGIQERNITTIGIDTCAEHSKYFSYRYAMKNSNGVCGRQITAICL